MPNSIESINQEWEEFCKKTYADWKKTQPLIPIYIYNPHWMFDVAEERSKKWVEFIHKLGDEWWRAKGYKVEWPEFPNDSLKIQRINNG
jgi:hypothetical protein